MSKVARCEDVIKQGLLSPLSLRTLRQKFVLVIEPDDVFLIVHIALPVLRSESLLVLRALSGRRELSAMDPKVV